MRLIAWSGWALVGGGIVTMALNLGLTPFMPSGVPFVSIAASQLFLWRQGASALAAALLLFGSVGLYLRQAQRLGVVGTAAFLLAFFGSALLLAWEWVDVFVLRSLAFTSPEGLEALERADGLNLYDLGALIPVSLFAAGWLAFVVATLRTGVYSRWPSCLVLTGLFLTPALTGILGLWGAGLGSALLGAGWVWFGIETAVKPPKALGL